LKTQEKCSPATDSQRRSGSSRPCRTRRDAWKSACSPFGWRVGKIDRSSWNMH